MSKVIDITGVIEEGMWNYEEPFPKINIVPLPPVPWIKNPVYCEIFKGIHSQTGTYLETPAHHFGNDSDKTYLLIEVPPENMVEVPCVVLNIGMCDMPADGVRRPITVQDLEGCPNASLIEEGDAIVVGTGWGRYWMHENYLEGSPYFTKAAMDWIIEKKPLILGSDLARWDNLQNPQGFFTDFYEADILMAGPFVNLEEVTKPRVKLTILPLKVPRTSAAPSRAVIIED